MSTFVAILIVIALGTLVAFYFNRQQKSNLNRSVEKARATASRIDKDARDEAREILDKANREAETRRAEIQKANNLLLTREQALDEKQADYDQRLEKLRSQEAEIDEAKALAYKIRDQQEAKLEKIAKLSKEEAAERLMRMVERDISADLQGLISKLQAEAKATADDNAKTILIGAMERMAAETTQERTITTIKIDNDNIKGRIVGKEGRNLQSLQKLTGVDILFDEAPGTIVVSSHAPVRREVARQTLEMLIKDGRIHPGRIEQFFEKAQQQVQKDVMKAAESAAREVGVVGIPPAVLQLLGELRFRTSFGQNVLKHSLEMAQLAGVLANQIGANPAICKYAALVHDLGKAVTHKMEGKHHHLSGEILRKYGVAEEVAHAAEAHHDDIEATTIEAMVIRVVDAVSAARPGARNQGSENYIERLKTLENIANGFTGVEKSFAISGGREIRVFVHPNNLDDLQSIQLARDIALKVEAMMNYPGTIKVTVIRETRAIEYAK